MQITVTHCEALSPIQRPRKPAMVAPSSGKKTAPTNIALTLQGRDILDLDRTAVAEVNNKNGKANRGLSRGHG